MEAERVEAERVEAERVEAERVESERVEAERVESERIEAERVPKIIFIVPYRDREQQKIFFDLHMHRIMEDFPKNQYKIYYIHQKDSRDFNRGAIKNIGFIFIKNKYPNDYQNITRVFNDIDTMPYTKNFLNYETTQNTVKHFYGYKYALGGIVSMKGADFEKINGFPNFWSWGYEDNELNKRVLAANIFVDRNQFYPIMDKNIYQMKDGLFKTINRNEFDRYISRSEEGISSIQQLEYQENETTGIVDITSFSTGIEPTPDSNRDFDIRKGQGPFSIPIRQGRRGNMKMVF